MPDFNSFNYDKKIDDAFQNYNKDLVFSEDMQKKYGKMLSIFDKNGDNRLDSGELKSLWEKVKSFAGQDNTLSVSEADACVMDAATGWDYFKSMFTKKEAISKEFFAFLDMLTHNVVPKETPKVEEKVDMKANIASEAEYRNTPLTNQDIEEWNKVITDEAERYGFPSEVIVAIISRECYFDKPGNKFGCMQVFDINNIKTDRWGIWKKINNQLWGDMTNSLKTHNLSDKSTAIKAGIIAFQGAYARAIAEDQGWMLPAGKGKKQPDIARALEAIRDGKITLSPDKAKQIMKEALKIYNASNSRNAYSKDCIERLDLMGYDYTRPIIH